MAKIENKHLIMEYDERSGTIWRLSQANGGMNWVVSPELLDAAGYGEHKGCLLGKSRLQSDRGHADTGGMPPAKLQADSSSVRITYDLGFASLVHVFSLLADTLRWEIQLANQAGGPLQVSELLHWLPVSYVMHEERQPNLDASCSFVPSVCGDMSYILCKVRGGKGSDLLITNPGGGMRSTGSLCLYRNMFLEQGAPSLSGMVLYNVVHRSPRQQEKANPYAGWLQPEASQILTLGPGESFRDSLEFCFYPVGQEKDAMRKQGCAVVTYEPAVYTGRDTRVAVSYPQPVTRCILRTENGPEEIETRITCGDHEHSVTILPFASPGERSLEIGFADGRTTRVIFAVYEGTEEFIRAFCETTYHHRFVEDRTSPEYAAYTPVSRQGESCAKGSALLLKNLLTMPVPEEIQQVEKNAVFYLRTRWMDENFAAKKIYPGNFSRILDFDYLILAFLLLSRVDNSLLRLNSSETYLMWAYRTALTRFDDSVDVSSREYFETRLASLISWMQKELHEELLKNGFPEEAATMESIWRKHLEIQRGKIPDFSFVETEHYFDNAGISMTAETLLNGGFIEEGLVAAELLLANVGRTNDYRCFAPDRWWEALAPMYHNLWAAFPAKAMLTAYEKSLDHRYLFSAYRAMMPLFFNYDWRAVSTASVPARGEGKSTYCLTGPNMNNAFCSHNRFGQSVFQDDFFSAMDLAGDDWDMGADLVVYLETFGQKAYLVQEENEWQCVNGYVTEENGRVRVFSDAAYPTQYFVEKYAMWIRRSSASYTIASIVMEGAQCTEAVLCSVEDPGNTPLLCEKQGTVSEIFPRIRWKKDAVTPKCSCETP